MSPLLNLGCGSRFHASWINVDLAPSRPGVIGHDLSQPLPFPNDYFEAVYLSHVLEHFDSSQGRFLLQECFRVCAPRGMIRVVVPNLEEIVRLYLKYLEGALQGDGHAMICYDWMLLELYDQAVRTTSGGEMVMFIQTASPEIRDFLISRVGTSILGLQYSDSPKLADRLLRLMGQPKRVWYQMRRAMTLVLMRCLWGPDGIAMADEMLFRRNGEIHRWMYDRYSLCRALEVAGFSQARVCSAGESCVGDWSSFGLDTDPDGKAYKPDSVFCEAIKLG